MRALLGLLVASLPEPQVKLPNINLQNRVGVIVTPIPVVLPLSLTSPLPIHIVLVALIPVHVPSAIFVVIPMMVVLVPLVMVGSVVAVVLSQAYARDKDCPA